MRTISSPDRIPDGSIDRRRSRRALRRPRALGNAARVAVLLLVFDGFAAALGAQSTQDLIIERPDGTADTLSAAELGALRRVSGEAMAHGNRFTFEGYDLRDVLRLAGIDTLSRATRRRVVELIGADEYSAIIALADLDPTIGGRRAVLVDREDGRPLPPERAPRRVIIEGDHRPTRWVRQVVRIRVVELP